MTVRRNISADLEQLAVPIASLREDDDNLRLHGGESIDGLIASLERFGQQKPIVITPEGKVIAGNGVYRAAMALGWPEIAAVKMEAPPEEARLFGVTDNRSGELSDWNRPVLASELGEIMALDVDLGLHLGFTQGEIDGMTNALREGGAPPEREPSIPSRGLPPRGLVHATTVELATESDQQTWIDFQQLLRERYPLLASDGDRLIAYVRNL